ncbi:MAG: glycosyltransferase family 4 protein [Candidatus Aureabacteria bacterium]|nr:glycosyltransferase family 4 protein [Candidatus Auribacterota bacterium]
MKKPGILIICPFYPPNIGGVETHLDLLTDYLRREEYRVFVLTYRPLVTRVENYQAHERNGSVTVRRFWWPAGDWFDRTTPYPAAQFLYTVPGLLFCSLLWMSRNHRRVGVIHAHGFAAAFVARIIGIFFPGKRKVASTHFIYRRLESGSLYAVVFKWVFSGFDRILTAGDESARELRALGLDGEKMRVFRHWLDQEKFTEKDRLRCRAALGLPSDAKLIVLFVGRLLRMKGVFELLKAAESLPRDIYCVLVGDGPDAELLRSESRGVKNFILTGRKSHDAIADYLGACDFVILPSLAEEAQPMVIMEALAAGRPVVVTDKGAAKEMFDSRVGMTISPDPHSIRESVLDLYRHPEKLRTMESAARPFALEKYNAGNARIIAEAYQ